MVWTWYLWTYSKLEFEENVIRSKKSRELVNNFDSFSENCVWSLHEEYCGAEYSF